MLHEFTASVMNVNVLPVGLVFIAVTAFLGKKYMKYQKVVDQLEEYGKVKAQIDSGEKMIVFIIDSFKCTSCMHIFSKVKKMVEDAGLPFLAIDSRSQQNYVSHSDVPALLVFHGGKTVKDFDPVKDRPKADLTQYQSFIKEVEKEWKNL